LITGRETGPAPGAEFEVGTGQLLMAIVADQSHLFSAVRAISETFKPVPLFRGQFSDFFGTISFLANFINAAG
jgi:hypothetical protein